MSKSNKTHPAFGNINICRVSGHRKLHDSPLRHHHYIALRIQTADMDRDLNQHWHHPQKQVVEVLLSEAQFAQAITSLNTMGTPCTLSFYRDPITGEVQQPVLKDEDAASDRSMFDGEIQAKVDELTKLVNSAKTDVAAALANKAVPAKAREAALGVVERLRRILADLPFIQSQFVKAMEKTESHAKTEVVALANALVHQKGLEALGVTSRLLLGESEPEVKDIVEGTPTTKG